MLHNKSRDNVTIMSHAYMPTDLISRRKFSGSGLALPIEAAGIRHLSLLKKVLNKTTKVSETHLPYLTYLTLLILR